MDKSAVQSNLLRVLERIEEAALRAGRDPNEVRLVAVTKTQPIELIRAAIEAGAAFLGENYADEAAAKISQLGEGYEVQWHMIGHVQSRKARSVCQHFDYLHSLDRIKLAGALGRCLEDSGRRLPVLLECNTSGEESKFGWPAWDEASWAELEEPVAKIVELPYLEVRGLMTMAPYFDDGELARPYYAKLRRLSDYFRSRFPQANWSELSMGMSGDLEAAVYEGATWVRVGTAIFGERS
jgi:PLP dependent protein